MNLKDLRIGYAPYDATLTQPGDRRRFCYYAEKRNIKFEIAKPSETYDLVYVTHGADITVWSDYHKGDAKIIYELIDSYLAVPKTDWKGRFRGLAKYASGQYRHLRLSQWKTIERMCNRADAVTCTTLEQKKDLLSFCSNVHIILDIKSMYTQVKKDYAVGEVFNLVWEGMAQSIHSFHQIRDVLARLKKKRPIALHMVTALEYGEYLGKFPMRHTTDYIRKLFEFEDIFLYQWHHKLCSHIISACDMALIPIRHNDPFDWGKPEDKLLIFWLMGLPTIVTATPAHSRAMEAAGLKMACQSENDWAETIEHYMEDQSAREEAGKKGRAYAAEFNSDEKILKQWDHLFESITS